MHYMHKHCLLVKKNKATKPPKDFHYRLDGSNFLFYLIDVADCTMYKLQDMITA